MACYVRSAQKSEGQSIIILKKQLLERYEALPGHSEQIDLIDGNQPKTFE